MKREDAEIRAVETFRLRASAEAERYGGDRWVFLRELIQNSRDAGATRVEISTEAEDGIDRIRVTDDGSGMSLEHARRYLFRLYSSSKEGTGTAGRFGIGFWSVLRFGPGAVQICSRPGSGEAGWGLRLSGDLEELEAVPCAVDSGTEVVLERPSGDGDLGRRVTEAVHRDARFTRRRDATGRPLEVRVDGRLISAPMTLPPPCLEFKGRGLRGVVALGDEARVELFAHGLKVRTAAVLDDLLAADAPAARTAATDALHPQVLLDSERLRPLLARSDARDDRELRRLVERALRELDRLVTAQLDAVAPRSPARRLLDRWRGLVGRPWWLAAAGLAAVAAAVVLAVTITPRAVDTTPEAGQAAAAATSRSYRDLASSYRGPAATVLESEQRAVDVLYRPPEARPLLGALRVVGIGPGGRPLLARPGRPVDDGAPCREACLELEVRLDAGPGLLRLPLATGHVLDVGSVSLDPAVDHEVWGPLDRPAIRLSAPTRGVLRYRSGPGSADVGEIGRWPDVHGPAFERGMSEDAVVEAAVGWVRDRIPYDPGTEAARRLEAMTFSGVDPLRAALEVGAGDCDVQNTVLAAVLAAAGLDSRLAVGFVGEEGRALPGLHAWAEYRGGGGRWRAADASAAPLAPHPVAADVVPRVRVGPPSSAAAPPEPILPVSRLLPVAAAAALAAVAAGLAGLLLLRRPRRRIRTDGGVEVADLVRGLVEHPGSYGASTTLRTRPVVPLVGGGAVSVRRAAWLAGRGRLFVATRRGELARRAARHGVVVDGGLDTGRVVGEAFAAIDLDRWQRQLDEGEPSTWSAAAERLLQSWQSGWIVREARGLDQPVRVLDLGRRRERVALVDEAGGVARRAAAVSARLGALIVAEAVAHVAEPAGRRRARVVSRLARSALAGLGDGP